MLDEQDLQVLQRLFDQSEARIMARMDRIESRIDQLEARMDRIEARMDQIEARMDRIEARMDQMEARMDRMEARMDQMEDQMGQFKVRMDQLEESIKGTESRIMAYIESAVMPKFGLLAEGHQMLRETLAPRNRVEELEEEVAFLKPLVMSMLTDIDKLKKAQ